MPAHISIVGMYTKVTNLVSVDTTSRSGHWAGLSPFLIGPCPLYDGYTAANMENAWQFSKVYADQIDADENPTEAWWDWAKTGWSDHKAHRYPRGKGARPLYSYWKGQKLGYIQARKAIYGPLYAAAVQQGDSWCRLQELYQKETRITFRDYDGYDHEARGLSLSDVLNSPVRKMGHAFVLKMLLTNDKALEEFQM